MRNFKVEMINENTWLFEGAAATGKSTLARMIQKGVHLTIESYDIYKIEQVIKCEANRIRPIKFSNAKAGPYTTIYICIDPNVANEVREYLNMSEQMKARVYRKGIGAPMKKIHAQDMSENEKGKKYIINKDNEDAVKRAIEEGFTGGLHEKFMTQFAKDARIPLKYLTTTDNVDVDGAYSKYILNLQNRVMAAIPGMTAYRLSGMSAKDFVNRRMYVARSKSKRRHAISKLTKKVLYHDRVLSKFTIHTLSLMSRDSKLYLLYMLKTMNRSVYGKFGGNKNEKII